MNSKVIEGPEWAEGCEDCRYGVLLAPEPNKGLPLYIAWPAMIEQTTFCECRAGVMREAWSRRKREESGSTNKRNHSSIEGSTGRERAGAIQIPPWESWARARIEGDTTSE